MKDFFLNINNNYTISLLSLPHIILIIITFLLVSLIIYNKNNIRKISIKSKKIIRVAFGIILLINLILRRGSFLYYGVYDWHNHLDINFCNFTSIIFIIYSFVGNKKLLNIGCHMSLVGPLIAIILPSYNLNPYGYSFYSFILLHHILFIFSFVFLFLEDIKIEKGSLTKVIEFLTIYYSIIFVFNYCFKVSYNYPLSFVNSSLIKLPIINNLAKIDLIVFIIYFVIVIGLLIIGNKALKYITKNEKEANK